MPARVVVRVHPCLRLAKTKEHYHAILPFANAEVKRRRNRRVRTDAARDAFDKAKAIERKVVKTRERRDPFLLGYGITCSTTASALIPRPR